MGLDMWMYGIKDISNDEIPDNMPESWYEAHGYKMIEYYEDDDEFDKMYHDMCNYSVIRNVEYIETDADELAYWRKEYDLQDLIYNEYNGEIYNCGFHRLNNEIMRKINRYLRARNMSKQNINDDEYIVKMYHEWY